ncbi:phage integrase N-terminal SAM-like domain-containing protein [Rhodohalobacter sp. 614A]|uniref:phage integrase N-terminal SAM-like domain-containing protein n=1 Tax=Rhodohalobacter sp. 614A TaxID=2908649 RepID=UPI001F1F9161|nr:phage integrase N-terminal SAM-like domain-containing protein [Rhodohalobacter sp. 614A]
MNRALILSKLRIEIRRKEAGYPTERTMIRVARHFMDRMSLTHASQIREWHKDLFLSQLKNDENISDEELLQTKSSLLFLFEKVLKPSSSFIQPNEEAEREPGVFRITG